MCPDGFIYKWVGPREGRWSHTRTLDKDIPYQQVGTLDLGNKHIRVCVVCVM